MTETPPPVGRTSATEREAITSEKFTFWLPDEVIVNPFDIVAVEQVNNAGASHRCAYPPGQLHLQQLRPVGRRAQH
jgi:hypothetical protein